MIVRIRMRMICSNGMLNTKHKGRRMIRIRMRMRMSGNVMPNTKLKRGWMLRMSSNGMSNTKVI